MNPKQYTLALLVSAAGATGLSAATYAQDFTYDDGTTDLGDGSTIGSDVNNVTGTINSVQSNALRITQVDTGSQRASYRIPALAGSSQGWTATFDITMTDAVGGNPPADGFSFNWGAIPDLTANGAGADAHGAAEAGHGSLDEISAIVDTWQNGDTGNPPGVGLLQDGAGLAGGRIDGSVVPTDGSVTGTVSISWSPDSMSFITTGLGTNANFVDVPHTFTGDDSHSWVFSARTGGATQDLIIDNLVITTIPEPSSLALFGLGLVGVIARRRR